MLTEEELRAALHSTALGLSGAITAFLSSFTAFYRRTAVATTAFLHRAWAVGCARACQTLPPPQPASRRAPEFLIYGCVHTGSS